MCINCNIFPKDATFTCPICNPCQTLLTESKTDSDNSDYLFSDYLEYKEYTDIDDGFDREMFDFFD